MNQRYILCFVPSGDPSSRYGHYFFHKFMVPELIEAKGYRPIVLEGENARFTPFAQALIKYDPPFIFTVGGHGAHNLLSGQWKEPVLAVPGIAKEIPGVGEIVVKKGNAYLLRGRAVYTISCHTTRTLGYQAVARYGALVFAGYRRSFVWVVSEEADPRTDPYAPPFFDAAFHFLRCLLDGMSFDDAHTETVFAFLREADKTTDPDVKRYLEWDAKILEVYGDGSLTLDVLYAKNLIPSYT